MRGRLGVDEALCACRLGHRAEPLGVLARIRLDLDVGDHDVGARARERQRVGAAEPARTTGDESDATREVDLNHCGTEAPLVGAVLRMPGFAGIRLN